MSRGGVFIKSKYNYSAKQYLLFFVTACVLTLSAFAITTRSSNAETAPTSVAVQTESEPAKATAAVPEPTSSILEVDTEKTETGDVGSVQGSSMTENASSKSNSTKTESTSSKNDSSKTESTSSKSNSSKTESTSSKSNSSKTESTSSKSNSSKTESNSSKNDSSKTESTSSKSNSSKTESNSSKNDSSKSESNSSKNDSSKSESKSEGSAKSTVDDKAVESDSDIVAKTKIPPKEYHIEVEHISQNNVMPTGCEIVSTKMVLDYYGMDRLSLGDVLSHLKCSDLKVSKDGKLYGLSPFQAFIGDPKKTSGFGCYPPVIMDMIEDFEFGNLYAEDTSSLPLDFIAETYVTQDIPVLVWATIGMGDSYLTDSWYLCDEKGKITKEKYTWRAEEHCIVLIGYDEKYYYFCDPLSLQDIVKYEKSLVEKRYKEIGSYSMIIRPY